MPDSPTSDAPASSPSSPAGGPEDDPSPGAGLPRPAGRRPTDAHVTFRDVTRVLGDQPVLADIDLTAHSGELFGLVGPSGCGKTTLVRLIVGLLTPTEGEVLVRGVPPGDFAPRDRQRIGYLPQEFSLYPMLTVEENARFIAGLYGLSWFRRRRRIREVLEFLEIWDARGRLAEHISGGMKRRLGLACSMLHRPSLLVVDEPTAGLDPDLRAHIWEHLREVQQQGTTIFLTTQYIEEAERCDSVAVLDGGRMAALGSPADLRQRADISDTIDIEVDGLTPDDIRALWRLASVKDVRRAGPNRLLVRTDEGASAIPAISEEFAARDRRVTSIDAHQASFEEIFLRLVEQSRT
ncbi:MAG: ABC transporter ATP-binding protein [Dehalococcoidia bacterium]